MVVPPGVLERHDRRRSYMVPTPSQNLPIHQQISFFGSPVNVGYASGDTVYKYSDQIAKSVSSRRPRKTLTPSLLP